MREIVVVVAAGHFKRLHESAAESLFATICDALEEKLGKMEEWSRPDGKQLLPRRMVWTHHYPGSGRKVVRPIVEDAVRKWNEVEEVTTRRSMTIVFAAQN